MGQLNHTGEQLDQAIAMVLAGYADVSEVDAAEADVKAGKKFVKANGAVATGTKAEPSGNQDITTTAEYDVASKATARVSAAERAKIIASNIKKNVSILGVTGSYEGAEIQWIDGGELTIVDGHAYAQLPQGTFVDITRLSIIQGVLDDDSYEATLMERGTYSAKFGCEIGQYFYELVIDEQDDMTVTRYEKGYNVSWQITNGTASGSTSTYGAPNTAAVVISPAQGYKNPASVTVTGATYAYDKTSGTVTVTNAPGDVVVTAECEAASNASKITLNGTVSKPLVFRIERQVDEVNPIIYDGVSYGGHGTHNYPSWIFKVPVDGSDIPLEFGFPVSTGGQLYFKCSSSNYEGFYYNSDKNDYTQWCSESGNLTAVFYDENGNVIATKTARLDGTITVPSQDEGGTARMHVHITINIT